MEDEKKSGLPRLLVWHNSLTPVPKLTISFLTNLVVWIIGGLLTEVIAGEGRSFKYTLVSAAFMAFFMTYFWNYRTVHTLWRSRKK